MSTLGKYKLIREVGRGAMGTVYLGRDAFLERAVAIKVAHFDAAAEGGRDELFKALFFNETRTAGLLHHPNIVQIYDAGIEDENYYIVMEYVSGEESLEAYCARERLLPLARIAEIVFKCAEALDHSHRKGVIHRDIKPGNILIDETGAVKVADFSVALLTDPGFVDTQWMGPVGSPLYMSPEQILEQNITSQTDLFSLGVVLYELLTGRHPFAADTLAGLTHRILHLEPDRADKYRSDLSASLLAIIDRALAKRRDERYATALDLAADLSQTFRELKNPVDGGQFEGRVGTLRQLAFFQAFADAEIWEILRWASWEEFSDGASIIVDGETGDAFYIIVRGAVSVEKDSQRIAVLEAGECFGEIAYLGSHERSATVVASGPVSALRINASLIDRASEGCQIQFQRVFIQTLIERLVQTTRMLAAKN